MTVPMILIGDGWANPTGLARIARDLHAVLQPVAQPIYVGYHPPGLVHGSPGVTGQFSWSYLGDDWGAEYVVDWIRRTFHPELPGIVFIVWDPARAYFYLQQVRQQLPGWQVWNYAAVDGTTERGRLGLLGDGAAVGVDRVLAYTEYGMQVLRTIRGRSVSALPHGLQIPRFVYDPTIAQQVHPRYGADPNGWLFGCVATNHPRKDLQLFCWLLSELRDRGERVYGWLHTDSIDRHWNIPTLIQEYDLASRLRVTTGQYADQEMQQLYAACSLTICVGRGEGFGYPIVESLACGTPVLAMDYAGGAELTPHPWRYPIQAIDYSYAGIGRPTADRGQTLARVKTLMDWIEETPLAEVQAYCRGAVAHLQWEYLRPRWESWVRQGLEKL